MPRPSSGIGTLQGHAGRRRLRRTLFPCQPARVRPRPARRGRARHGHRRASEGGARRRAAPLALPLRADRQRHQRGRSSSRSSAGSRARCASTGSRPSVEAHVMAAARVRERCGIPGTSERTTFLCRDKPAMKEALRAAGVPCAQSIGSADVAEIREFAATRGLPAHREAARRRGRLGHRAASTRQRSSTAALALLPGRSRSKRRRGGVHRGPRRLLRHDHDRRGASSTTS